MIPRGGWWGDWGGVLLTFQLLTLYFGDQRGATETQQDPLPGLGAWVLAGLTEGPCLPSLAPRGLAWHPRAPAMSHPRLGRAVSQSRIRVPGILGARLGGTGPEWDTARRHRPTGTSVSESWAGLRPSAGRWGPTGVFTFHPAVGRFPGMGGGPTRSRRQEHIGGCHLL